MNDIIRCSSLPRFARCQQSVLGDAPWVEVDHDVEAARVGTAVHEMIRAWFDDVLTGEVTQNTCAGLGVQQSEVWPLVNTAKKIAEELGLGHPDVMEDEIADGILSGHPDAEWTKAGAYWIGDWKSSRNDPDYFHQLMGYAWLRRGIIRALPGGCHLFVAWLRDGAAERYHVTIDEIEKWYSDLRAKHAARAGSRYTTGDHCTYCPRCADCPAQHEDMRRAMSVVGQSQEIDVTNLDGATIANVNHKFKLLASLGKAWDLAIRNRIRATGPIDCGDGHALTLVTENGKREIDTLKAWDVMSERLDDEELAACLTVRSTALADAVAKKAPKRKGAEAVRNLWDALAKADAVKQGTVEKLKELRIQNLPEKKEIAE